MEMLWKKYDRQQIYQEYQRIYAIIFTDLNEEDKNIKEKRYLKSIVPEKCFNCFREMLQLFLLPIVFEKRERDRDLRKWV